VRECELRVRLKRGEIDCATRGMFPSGFSLSLSLSLAIAFFMKTVAWCCVAGLSLAALARLGGAVAKA